MRRSAKRFSSVCTQINNNDDFISTPLIRMELKSSLKYFENFFSKEKYVYPLNAQTVALTKIQNKRAIPIYICDNSKLMRPTEECKFIINDFEDYKLNTINEDTIKYMIELAKDDLTCISIYEQILFKFGDQKLLEKFQLGILSSSVFKTKKYSKLLKHISIHTYLDILKRKKILVPIHSIIIPKKFKGTEFNFKKLINKYDVSLVDLSILNRDFSLYAEKLVPKKDLLKFYLDFAKYFHSNYSYNHPTKKDFFWKFTRITNEHYYELIKQNAFNIELVKKEDNSEELCWLAIKSIPDSIKYINEDNLTLDMCIYAIIQKNSLIKELPLKFQNLVKINLKSTLC